jgi:hypothetical protein
MLKTVRLGCIGGARRRLVDSGNDLVVVVVVVVAIVVIVAIQRLVNTADERVDATNAQ